MNIKDAVKPLKPLVPAAIWAIARRFSSRRNLKAFPRRIVSHTYHGQPLRVVIADSLAEGWYDHDGPRMHEIDRLQSSKLKRGAVVYDCGAHQGVVAMILAGACGPQGRVIAIEANAHNARVARENAKMNAIGSAPIEVVEAALAGRVGSLYFNENLNGQISHESNRGAGKVRVAAVTLNSLTESYPLPDVIFLDIEGAEWDALKACDKVFRNGRMPDWFVEVHAGAGLEDLGGSPQEIVDFFRTRDYSLEVSVNDGEPFEPLATLPTGRFFLLAFHKNGASAPPASTRTNRAQTYG